MNDHPYINIATSAARNAGRLMCRALLQHKIPNISQKGRHDFVTDIDKQCEVIIIDEILKAYPQHGIIGEESGAQGDAASEVQWIIDPLDGTTNFIQGIPHFCISIGVRDKGRMEHGVIYDPIRDELFITSRGKGVQCNQQRLRVTRKGGLEHALLGTGYPFRDKALADPFMASFQALFPIISDIRRSGSAALDLAYVAAGRLDGFWEWGLSVWDVAAGSLMVREAGGLVCDIDGSDNYCQSGNIMAGNTRLIKEMLQLFKDKVPGV